MKKRIGISFAALGLLLAGVLAALWLKPDPLPSPADVPDRTTTAVQAESLDPSVPAMDREVVASESQPSDSTVQSLPESAAQPASTILDKLGLLEKGLEQFESARRTSDVEKQISTSTILLGASIAAVLDEQARFIESYPDGRVPKTGVGENWMSVNARKYLVSHAEFPEYAALQEFKQTWWHRHDGTLEAVRKGLVPTPEPAPLAFPPELFDQIDERAQEARRLARKERERNRKP